MAQTWIDIEENENCGYHPIQTFEVKGRERKAASAIVPEVYGGREGPHEVVGWCSEGGGSPCDVAVVEVGDSGAGSSLLIYGGDHGIRLRPAGSDEDWALSAESQFGEPYLLLSVSAAIDLRS